MSVLLQNPTIPGTFLAATNYSTAPASSFVSVADMNGDKKPDLVVTDGDGIVVRLQDPVTPGSFLAQTIIAN